MICSLKLRKRGGIILKSSLSFLGSSEIGPQNSQGLFTEGDLDDLIMSIIPNKLNQSSKFSTLMSDTMG